MSAETRRAHGTDGQGAWPLRTVSLTVTDNTGDRWTATGLLARHPRRGRTARRAGRALAVLLQAGLIATVSLVLSWEMALVHNWWPVVPRLPYEVSLRLVVLATGAIVATTILTQVITFLTDAHIGDRPAGAVRIRGGGRGQT